MHKLLAPKFSRRLRLRDLVAYARDLAQQPAHRLTETTTLAGLCVLLAVAGCTRTPRPRVTPGPVAAHQWHRL